MCEAGRFVTFLLFRWMNCGQADFKCGKKKKKRGESGAVGEYSATTF